MGETLNSIGEAASNAADDLFFDKTDSIFSWIKNLITWEHLFKLIGSIFIIFIIFI